MKFALFWVFALTTASAGQSTGPATTRGLCSPANTGSNNTFTINCGVGKAQGDALLKIVNKILANQIDPNAVMAKLDEIGRDVKNLKQGIYTGYDFNGARREQRPGKTTVIGGKETVIFQEMLRLNDARRWYDLRKLADDQITKTPDWLTPYLFSGIANIALGNREIGVSRLQFVQAQAPDNPDYAEAGRILRQSSNQR